MKKNKIVLGMLTLSSLILSSHAIAANTTSSIQTTASIESLCTLNTISDVEFPLPLTPPANGIFNVAESPTLTIQCNKNYPTNINYNVIGSAWGTYNFSSVHGDTFPTFMDNQISDNDGDILGLSFTSEVTNTPVGNIKKTDVNIDLFIKYPLGQDNKPLYVTPGNYQWTYEISITY